jgi:superfamily II DNA or RNA helicase
MDSSAHERRKSLKMLGVLKEDLDPKVHRANMSVLRNDLPSKTEFVITVPLTELQRQAYSIYVQSMTEGNAYATTKSGEVTQSTIWHWLAVLSLLCNHPECFNTKLHERREDARKGVASSITTPQSADTDLEESGSIDMNSSAWKVGVSKDLVQAEAALFNQAPDMKSVDLSYKVKVLCQILDASKEAGDKALVFSQSIPTLNFLEGLFNRQGRKFARLDGKTKISTRQTSIKQFNIGTTDIYLISTNAGGLGLNLIGANRVIIFDFKFNPIMEEQAVGRAYRIGQKKETFVYRFVAGGTFESSVHNRTVFKAQLASRVVDKKNPLAYVMKKLGDYLFEPTEVAQEDLSKFRGLDPLVLDKILEIQDKEPTIRAIVQTDTFEVDANDNLTTEEQEEVRQMISSEKLKRSDPQKWLREKQKWDYEVHARRYPVPQTHLQHHPPPRFSNTPLATHLVSHPGSQAMHQSGSAESIPSSVSNGMKPPGTPSANNQAIKYTVAGSQKGSEVGLQNTGTPMLSQAGFRISFHHPIPGMKPSQPTNQQSQQSDPPLNIQDIRIPQSATQMIVSTNVEDEGKKGKLTQSASDVQHQCKSTIPAGQPERQEEQPQSKSASPQISEITHHARARSPILGAGTKVRSLTPGHSDSSLSDNLRILDERATSQKSIPNPMKPNYASKPKSTSYNSIQEKRTKVRLSIKFQNNPCLTRFNSAAAP